MDLALIYETKSLVLHTRADSLYGISDLHQLAESLQGAVASYEKYARSPMRIHIHIGRYRQTRPVTLISRFRARITTLDNVGISYYSGLSSTEYQRICCLTAIVQMRALAENPLLEPEGLECLPESLCFFSWQNSLQDYCRVFEKRTICPGCVNFYHALGVDHELIEMRELISSL